MAELLINNWWGIGNDEYLQTWSDLFDARDIDFSSTRLIKSNWAYNKGTSILTASSWIIKKYTKNTYTHVLSIHDWSTTYASIWDWTTLRNIWYNSYTHQTVWYWNGTYNEATAQNEIRHFFIPYNSARIVYTNYNWSSISTIDTSAYPRLTDSSLIPGASCYLWKWAIIFSYGNGIHEINPSPNTPTYNWEKVTLPIGAFVHSISYFNGQIWFIYTIKGQSSTFIQGCSYDSVTYKLNNYITEISGQVCIGAATDSNIIYWVSEKTINVFDWQNNTIVKKLYTRNGIDDYFYSPSGWSENICSFNDWFLRVLWVNKVYFYWNKRTGFAKNLVEMKLDSGYVPLALGNDWYSIISDWTNHRISLIWSNYNATSYVVTVPYTAGQFGRNKSGLSARIGYNIKPTNWGSVNVSIITDTIIRANSNVEDYTDYVTIATISDATKTFYDITPDMIAKALQTAWYSNEWALMKLKITLTNWGSTTGDNWETRYLNSPEVFDLYINHEEVK